LGYIFVDSEEGRLACGAVGKGRLAEPRVIVDKVVDVLGGSDYIGKRILITAGGTSEKIDGVRCITNRSSGKMGACLAREAMLRGADVTVVLGNATAEMPKGVDIVKVVSTEDMYKAVMDRVSGVDYVIKAAAPADYRVENATDKKIKDKSLTLKLVKNVDIAQEVGKIKGDKKLVIFAAECDNLLEYAKSKLISKNADLVVANDVSQAGVGFESDLNEVTIIDRSGKEVSSGKKSKAEIAKLILDEMKKL
jgi:phosphopantothenoylcysteine decarboxylase/phosphopantothenate--cysteine ligase